MKTTDYPYLSKNGTDPKEIPHAPEIEEVVIGEILVDSTCLPEVCQTLIPDMFFSLFPTVVFETVLRLYRSGKLVDIQTVTNALRDSGQLEVIGGPMYLLKLTHGVVSSRMVHQHILILHEKHIRRKTIEMSEGLIELAYNSAGVDEIRQELNSLMDTIDNITAGGERPVSSLKVIKDTMAEIEEEAKWLKEGKRPGVPTGILKVDYRLGNMRPGTVTVLGARTGSGKTSVALFAARNAAYERKRIIFLGFEQRKEDLMRTMLASVTNVDRIKLRDSDLTDADWKELHKGVSVLEKMSIGWMDNSRINALQISAIVRSVIRREGCDLLIVDYLQLVPSHIKTPVREQEVSAISKELKTLALSENIAILALSQLNRDASNKEPELHNLRESGSLEQDADNVLLLWKPEEEAESNLIKLKIAKNRRGLVGITDLYHDDKFLNFGTDPNFQNAPPVTSLSPGNVKLPF